MRSLLVFIGGMSLCMASMSVSAEELKLLGGSVHLPAGFEVVARTRQFNRAYGLRASDSVELSAPDGKHARLVAIYFSPDKVDASFAEKIVREQAEKAGKEVGVRTATQLKQGGFQFYFYDGPSKSREFAQRMGMTAAISGGVYNVILLAEDVGVLTPEVARSLQALRLDFASLLTAKGSFDAELSTAVQNQMMQTPVGPLGPGKGVSARLNSSEIRTDPQGKVVYRRRGFLLHKEGFWTIQNLLVSAGCGRDDAKVRADHLAMREEQQFEDPKERYTKVTPARPARMLGIDALSADADGGRVGPIVRTDVTRYAAEQAGTMYLVHIERLNGAPIEKSLSQQLESASLQCRLDIPFGGERIEAATAAQ